jgi:hypothetical protein
MAGLLVDAAADIDTAACADDEPEGAVMLPVDMTDSVKSAVVSELSRARGVRQGASFVCVSDARWYKRTESGLVHWPRHKVQIFSSEGSSGRPALERIGSQQTTLDGDMDLISQFLAST